MADNKEEIQSLSEENHYTIEKNVAENLADNDGMTADNAASSGQFLADSITIQAENVPDSIAAEEYNLVSEDDRQTTNSENIEFFDKISILELQKKYQIKRDALYKRMTYLRITTYKVSGRACLYPEQVAHMDGLHKHIKGGNKMDTYPKPEPTGPQKLEIQQTEPLQTLLDVEVEVENTGSAITLQQSNIQQSNINEESADNYETKLLPVKAGVGECEMVKIDTQAQILAATRYALTEELADYYAETGNFSIPELDEFVRQRREKTNQQWEKIHATSHPKYLAQLLIDRAKARKTVGIQNQNQKEAPAS